MTLKWEQIDDYTVRANRTIQVKNGKISIPPTTYDIVERILRDGVHGYQEAPAHEYLLTAAINDVNMPRTAMHYAHLAVKLWNAGFRFGCGLDAVYRSLCNNTVQFYHEDVVAPENERHIQVTEGFERMTLPMNERDL